MDFAILEVEVSTRIRHATLGHVEASRLERGIPAYNAAISMTKYFAPDQLSESLLKEKNGNEQRYMESLATGIASSTAFGERHSLNVPSVWGMSGSGVFDVANAELIGLLNTNRTDSRTNEVLPISGFIPLSSIRRNIKSQLRSKRSRWPDDPKVKAKVQETFLR